MGRGLSAITGDAFSYYYNPGGMASMQGLNLTGSFGNPYYLYNNAYYDYFSASYKIKKYGTIGFSSDNFAYGKSVNIYDVSDRQVYSNTNQLSNARMTLSSEIIKDLFVGINLNLFQPNFDGSGLNFGDLVKGVSEYVFYFDIGLIKSFNLNSKDSKDSKTISQNIILGASLINVNSAEIKILEESEGNRLPVIFRIGASYNLFIDDKKIISRLKSYNLLFNLEAEDLFNSKYYGGIHTGLEFSFLEILFLRGGYYTQNVNDECTYCNEDVHEFTYGFGLNVPLKQLTNSKVPVEVMIDFVKLRQPLIENANDDFRVLSLKLNCVF